MAVEPVEGDTVQSNTFARNTAALAFAMGMAYGGRRDYYHNFAWDRNPDAEDYYAQFLRNPWANAVISLPSETAFRDPPIVEDTQDTDADTETQFEQDIESFVRSTRCWYYAKRAHKLSRIAQFGVLMIGWADGEGQDFKNPVDENALGRNNADSAVRWLRPFSQVSVLDIKYDDSPERFGLPKLYKIDFADENQAGTDDDYLRGQSERWVHHSRIIHIAEDLLDDEVRGTPALQPVYNVVTDLEKTLGAAAEIVYSIARPGLHANIDKDADLDDDAKQQVDDELTSFSDDLQPFVRTQGVDVERIAGEDVDPAPTQNALIEALAAQTGIPQKVLKGNESGEVAGSQDIRSYYGTIQELRQQVLGPQIARELVKRLIKYGVVASPEGGRFDVEWEPLAEQDEKEQSEITDNLANAASKLQKYPGFSSEDAAELVRTGELPDEIEGAGDIEPMDQAEDAGAPPTDTPAAIADGGEDQSDDA